MESPLLIATLSRSTYAVSKLLVPVGTSVEGGWIRVEWTWHAVICICIYRMAQRGAPERPGAQADRAGLCPIHRRLRNGRSHGGKASPRLTAL